MNYRQPTVAEAVDYVQRLLVADSKVDALNHWRMRYDSWFVGQVENELMSRETKLTFKEMI